jgi:hypothetical protein
MGAEIVGRALSDVRDDGRRRASADRFGATAAPGTVRQRGGIAVMFAAVLLVIVGFCGLAIDLGMLYNRRVEVQSMVDAAALAAAKQLNGTSAGVTNAVTAASDRLTNTDDGVTYAYLQSHAAWSPSAIKFARRSDGPWVDESTASGAPQGYLFAKVDTNGLNSAITEVQTLLMGVLSTDFGTVRVGARAIAGPYSINVAPLAVCALSTTAGQAKGTELVEYGFRRGVNYDLMKLNPDPADTEGANFIIDPFAAPDSAGSAGDFALGLVKPFVCTGSLAIPRVTGGAISVQRPFPLASVYQQLNSRFGTYTQPCTAQTAPADANVKPFVFDATYGGVTAWTNPTPAGQAASLAPTPGPMWTVADASATPPNAASYGPLWSYARAVPYTAYTAGALEPAGGYTTFTTGAWSSIYPVATGSAPAVKASYPTGTTPTSTPYFATSGSTFFSAPTSGGPGVRNRRVLNVPLLSCPVSGGAVSSATVLAVGRFFMTVPADDTHLFAEFAGVLPEQSLTGGNLELH